MDQGNKFGAKGAMNLNRKDPDGNSRPSEQWKQMGNTEKKVGNNFGAKGDMNISREGPEGNSRVSEQQWKQMIDTEKKVVLNAELRRMRELPGNSGYATHRIKVLNKVLELMANQVRTPSENEELELLFAGLSL